MRSRTGPLPVIRRPSRFRELLQRVGERDLLLPFGDLAYLAFFGKLSDQAAEIKAINKPGQKSYGIDITRERISLYNKNGTNDIEIIDLEEDGICLGTKAMVRINS